MNVTKKTQFTNKVAELTELVFISENNKKIRTILINNQPYFVALDVCQMLGILNHKDAIAKSLDDDEKLRSEISTSGQRREVNLINESGLYHLIFRSNKPEAKTFRKWVTDEVLPAIRKQGGYVALPKPTELFSGLHPRRAFDHKLWPYKEFIEKCGYSTRASSSQRRAKYGNHFALLDGKLYITEHFALHLFHQKRVINNRQALKESQPVLPLNFGSTLTLPGHGNI